MEKRKIFDNTAAPTRLLNYGELSAFLGIAEATLRSWVYQKKIPFFKVGRCVRFDWHAIQNWLHKNGD